MGKYTHITELLDANGAVVEVWKFSAKRQPNGAFASVRTTFIEEGPPHGRTFGPEQLLTTGTRPEYLPPTDIDDSTVPVPDPDPVATVPMPDPEITYYASVPTQVEFSMHVFDDTGAEVPADIVASITGGKFRDDPAPTMTLPSPATFAWLPDIGVDCKIGFHADAHGIDITDVTESDPTDPTTVPVPDPDPTVDPDPTTTDPTTDPLPDPDLVIAPVIRSQKIADDGSKWDVWVEAPVGKIVTMTVVSGGIWHTGTASEVRIAGTEAKTGRLAVFLEDLAIGAVVQAEVSGLATATETIGGT